MPQTCAQCQSEAADDATACPSCGAPLGASAATTTATPAVNTPPPAAAAPAAPAAPAVNTPPPAAAAPAGSASTGSSVPAYKFDAARWSLADRIAGIASIVLFISLFLSWFGVSVIGITVTASGLSAHGYLYIVLILCILIVAYLVLRAGWDELPMSANVPHLTVMLVATVVNLVLVFIGFIFKPGGSGVGWEFGAFVALIAAIVAAAPYAVPQLRAKTMS
ncbi:MAG: zinc ribbon domain-containing protein [Acidimicrobiales bacterium]